mmetsp:Transcript_35326/g.64622  ORF Transcript_35326/g.64622 Transcript_35326/m.64622 type:complete len:204 (+) Transcript_35326:1198-1809(+)
MSRMMHGPSLSETRWSSCHKIPPMLETAQDWMLTAWLGSSMRHYSRQRASRCRSKSMQGQRVIAVASLCLLQIAQREEAAREVRSKWWGYSTRRSCCPNQLLWRRMRVMTWMHCLTARRSTSLVSGHLRVAAPCLKPTTWMGSSARHRRCSAGLLLHSIASSLHQMARGCRVWKGCLIVEMFHQSAHRQLSTHRLWMTKVAVA